MSSEGTEEASHAPNAQSYSHGLAGVSTQLVVGVQEIYGQHDAYREVYVARCCP